MRRETAILTKSPAQIQEAVGKLNEERSSRASKLVEHYSKLPGLKGLDTLPKDKAHNLAIALRNQEQYMKEELHLSETTTSNAFQSMPQNVLKLVRLSYPNSIRSELFVEWAMETARDLLFYIDPVYTTPTASPVRGATNEEKIYDNPVADFSSEYETEDGTFVSGLRYAGTLSNAPLRPFTVAIFAVDSNGRGRQIATDDGAGYLIGSAIDMTQTHSINYTTGDYDLTFLTSKPDTVTIKYSFDSEVTSNFSNIGEVSIRARSIRFDVKPFPLGVSWTQMTELLIGTTLGVDAKEALYTAVGDELKKALDLQALERAYRVAKTNPMVVWDADWIAGGADSQVAHAQSVTQAFGKAKNQMLESIFRGGVTSAFCGGEVVEFLKLHYKFDTTGAQPEIGAYKVGSLFGTDIYWAPTTIIPTDEMVCVWKNPTVANDAALVLGTLLPMYVTNGGNPLEYKTFVKENGIAHFGDMKVTNPKYLVRVKLKGLVATTI